MQILSAEATAQGQRARSTPAADRPPHTSRSLGSPYVLASCSSQHHLPHVAGTRHWRPGVHSFFAVDALPPASSSLIPACSSHRTHPQRTAEDEAGVGAAGQARVHGRPTRTLAATAVGPEGFDAGSNRGSVDRLACIAAFPDRALFPDNVTHHHTPADLRCALAPLLAIEHFAERGISYEWMLYGDDDTLFLWRGLRHTLQALDPQMAYLVTDHFLDHNTLCCLPCNDTSKSGPPPDGQPDLPPAAPAAEQAGRPEDEAWLHGCPASPGAPACTPTAVCRHKYGSSARGASSGPSADATDDAVTDQTSGAEGSAARSAAGGTSTAAEGAAVARCVADEVNWLFGGAGMVLSAGLVRHLRARLPELRACIEAITLPADLPHGSDIMFGNCLWRLGVAATAPRLVRPFGKTRPRFAGLVTWQDLIAVDRDAAGDSTAASGTSGTAGGAVGTVGGTPVNGLNIGGTDDDGGAVPGGTSASSSTLSAELPAGVKTTVLAGRSAAYHERARAAWGAAVSLHGAPRRRQVEVADATMRAMAEGYDRAMKRWFNETCC